MEVKFNNKEIEKLYTTGKSRKYKLEKTIIKSFFKKIIILEAAIDIHDLQKTRSLNFEKIQGFDDRFSIRLNIKYRLEMTMEWTNIKCTIGIIAIEEISNHYGGK